MYSFFYLILYHITFFIKILFEQINVMKENNLSEENTNFLLYNYFFFFIVDHCFPYVYSI